MVINLNRIKSKLPKQYGRAIAMRLNSNFIDSQKVVRVFNGEITDPDIVVPVLDAAAQIIETHKKITRRIRKALNPA